MLATVPCSTLDTTAVFIRALAFCLRRILNDFLSTLEKKNDELILHELIGKSATQHIRNAIRDKNVEGPWKKDSLNNIHYKFLK